MLGGRFAAEETLLSLSGQIEEAVDWYGRYQALWERLDRDLPA
jgi:hypothetical protein